VSVDREPTIAVGLLERAEAVSFRLQGTFVGPSGARWPPGEYRVSAHGGRLRCSGPATLEAESLTLAAGGADSRFCLETVVGRDFHWQEREVQRFAGNLRILATSDGITAVNEVALETYLTSVVCSEMSATSPPELIKAHAVISRSWLLAQRRPDPHRGGASRGGATGGERIRWYDREAHADFDVCADDHCQRYQGTGVRSAAGLRAVEETRGEILTWEGRVCDARYGKCCGGVTEDFRVAWSDVEVPYLTPVVDAEGGSPPERALTDEASFRHYVQRPPDAYCDCSDGRILDAVLPPRDRRTTPRFFRWTLRLDAGRLGALLREKLRVELGRPLSLEPVERGESGRLARLKIRGEAGELVIGKELEIRRALSETHLLSSAFVVDAEGPPRRPETFVLRGAGWGHGVGLCQIGAAVMAWHGKRYREILLHYYRGAAVERGYR